MTRSTRKGVYTDHHVLKKVMCVRDLSDRAVVGSIKTWSRRSTILPDFVGITFLVHNGKKFIPVKVTEDMVGYKLGDFAPTRTIGKNTFVDKSKRK